MLIAYRHGMPRTIPMIFFFGSVGYASTHERYTIDPNMAVHSSMILSDKRSIVTMFPVTVTSTPKMCSKNPRMDAVIFSRKAKWSMK